MSLRISLCSVPVEGVGTKLSRSREEGSLGIVPKIAIVSLVEWMKFSGYPEESFDFYDIDMLYPSDDDIIEYFSNYQPDVVGLSAVVSTSYSQVERIARIIRDQLPNAWIVMGGNLSAVAEAVLTHTEVDICVIGDGEISWVQLLEYFEKVKPRKIKPTELLLIKGAAFLDEKFNIRLNGFGEKIPSEMMPYPDYDILRTGLKEYPEKLYNYFRPALGSGWFSFDDRANDPGRKPNIAGISTSKGCVAKCTFCQRSTKGYVTQPLKKLENHLDYLIDYHDVGFIQIVDENFGSDKQHSYEIVSMIHKKNLLWFASGVRCTSVTDENIKFYKDHGCSALKFGVESGSQKILDIMEKNFKVTDVYRALESCIRHEIYSPIAVMVGMPGEDNKTVMETGKFIGEISAKMGIHPEFTNYEIFYALPLPGTPLWEYGEQVGVIDKNTEGTVGYLNRVADAGTYKRYYINLNGARTSEVLFWDYLIRLEACRAFYLSEKVKSFSGWKRGYDSINDTWKSNPRTSLKYAALSFTHITYLLDAFVVKTRIFSIIPRFLLYPILRTLIYFEYIVQSLVPSNKENNIFIYKKRVKRLNNFANKDERSAKKRSLRGKVMKKRIDHIPNSVEDVRQVLRQGI
tara:strand:- start:515 stop:2404 length:1890 start_codon:yes stop_codon:yes gene_type:complete